MAKSTKTKQSAPPEPKEPKAPGKRKAVQLRRVAVAEDLAAEIDGLRASLVEMIGRYKLKLDSELIQLSMAARGHGNSDGKTRLLPSALAEKLLHEVRALDLKPHKGRAKDFQRLQNAVAELIEQLPSPK